MPRWSLEYAADAPRLARVRLTGPAAALAAAAILGLAACGWRRPCAGRLGCLTVGSGVMRVTSHGPRTEPAPGARPGAPGALLLRVVDDRDGAQVEGVQIRVAAQRARRPGRQGGAVVEGAVDETTPDPTLPVVAVAESRDTGWVEVGGLKPGGYVLELSRLGYCTKRDILSARPGARDTVTLDISIPICF